MRSGSVRSGHQTVSDYTLRQWFPNTQQSRWFLTACRRLEKLVLPSFFDSKSFILDGVNLVELSNNGFEWKNVTFYLGMVKYSDPSYIFSGDQDPHPQDLRLWWQQGHPARVKDFLTQEYYTVECWRSAGALSCDGANVSVEISQVVLDPYQIFHPQSVGERITRSTVPKKIVVTGRSVLLRLFRNRVLF